jgi:hypothetical protein
MTQPSLLDRVPDRVMADTSLDAYAHVILIDSVRRWV